MSISQKINDPKSLSKLKNQAMMFEDENALNWLINSDACVAIVPFSLCLKYFKIDSRLSIVFPTQGVPLMWHFILRRSKSNSESLVRWINSLESKLNVDKLLNEGWYLPFKNNYLQSKYKSDVSNIAKPSQSSWENSWSFPPLTNIQKIDLEKYWNKSLAP